MANMGVVPEGLLEDHQSGTRFTTRGTAHIRQHACPVSHVQFNFFLHDSSLRHNRSNPSSDRLSERPSSSPSLAQNALAIRDRGTPFEKMLNSSLHVGP